MAELDMILRIIHKHVGVRDLFDGAQELTGVETAGKAILAELTKAHCVVAEIAARRQHQIAKGYDAAHDDSHTDGSIARGAAAFALAASGPVTIKADRKRVGMYRGQESLTIYPSTIWPWENDFNASNPRDALIDAAAMIIAEIERLDRACPPDANAVSGISAVTGARLEDENHLPDLPQAARVSADNEQVNPIIQDVRHALHLLDGHLHRFHPSPDADGEYDDSDERESIVTIERLLQSSLAAPQAAAGTASREAFARRLANYDGNDFDAKPGIAEHDKGKYRKRADDILAFLANNEFRKWRRNQLIGSPTEEPANKGAEMGTVPYSKEPADFAEEAVLEITTSWWIVPTAFLVVIGFIVLMMAGRH